MVPRRGCLMGATALGVAGVCLLCPATVTLAYPVACFDYSYSYCPNDKYPVYFHDCSYDTESYDIVAWSWNFGDGGGSSQRNPSHQFTTIGTFTVSLEVTNNVPLFPQHDTEYKTIQVHHWNQPPECDFSYQPSNPDDETVVQFQDTTHDPDFGLPGGTIVDRYWDFGDGHLTSGESPTHLFAPGTWQVQLVVTDNGDCPYPMSDTCSMTITVVEANPPPDCCFTYDPPMPDDQTPVQFTDCSTDPNGEVAAWAWDFGDGQNSTEQNPSHLFAPGTYNVCLTVTDDWSPPESATCCQSITVEHINLPPTCSITYQPASPTTGDTVEFDSAASDPEGQIASVAWDFGDGGTASGETAAHQYAAGGSYPVSVTVCDEQDECATCEATVTVAWQPPQCAFTHEPASPQANEPVQFIDGSADPDGTIVAWAWDFGDGGASAVQHPTHTYISGGCFQATLTVTDSQGLSESCSTCVPVRSETEVPFCDAGWHMIAQPHSGDRALADIVVRDDWNDLALPFCDAVGSWVMNPLFYYDIELMGYGLCGCDGVPPPSQDHTMRMGHGYWLYTFQDYLTLVFP